MFENLSYEVQKTLKMMLETFQKYVFYVVETYIFRKLEISKLPKNIFVGDAASNIFEKNSSKTRYISPGV